MFAFGKESGVADASAGGTPQLLQGALAGSTVCALGVGCVAKHAAFLAGAPPAQPGVDAPVSFPWLRRRALLLCLLRAVDSPEVPPPIGAASA